MGLPVDDSYIEQAERDLGVRLPNSFKGRLRRNNGGELEVDDDVWQIHPVFDKSDRKRIIKTSSHIVHETAWSRQWPSFPKNAVAFAANGAGDRLIFLPLENEPERLGEAVYFWDHDTGAADKVAEDLADL